MIEFFDMGKHTVFVYIAYIFSIVILLLGFLIPHFTMKKETMKKNDKDNQ
jgi:heme exporter protein D|tara:strand:- start:728 stop:877 length:150 start_codon:yes stop_codon:yes gene_type:complete